VGDKRAALIGTAHVLEAAAWVLIVQETTAGTALTISAIMPYVIAGLLIVWNVAYGRHNRRRGERIAAANASLGRGEGAIVAVAGDQLSAQPG
jgi:hypothetical protein